MEESKEGEDMFSNEHSICGAEKEGDDGKRNKLVMGSSHIPATVTHMITL